MAQCVEKLKSLYQLVESDPVTYDELRKRSEVAATPGTRDPGFPATLALEKGKTVYVFKYLLSFKRRKRSNN